MEISLSKRYEEKFLSSLPELEPWMHTYKFGEHSYTGLYLRPGLNKDYSWCKPDSDKYLINQFQIAYRDSDPVGEADYYAKQLSLLDVEPNDSNILDIASATGKYSLMSVDAGFRHVYSSEIRPHQCEQQRLILECAEASCYRERITVSNDRISADVPKYAALYADKDIDVVLSFGLLYHLVNPIQHLLNCRDIARKGVVVYTKAHFSPFTSDGWIVKMEQREWTTHAFEGISWTPHYRWLPENAARLGFRSCKTVYPSIFHERVPGYDRFDRSTRLRLLTGRLCNRIIGPRIGFERAKHDAESADWKHIAFHPEWISYVLEV